MLSSESLKLMVLGLALAALAGCDRQSGREAQPQASADVTTKGGGLTGTLDRKHKGGAVPGLALKDAAGRTLDLASLRGRPVLVNLWATWCAPCIAELPTLDRLAQTRGARLKVLTVSQDLASSAGKVAPFLIERGVARLEPWLDPEGNLAFGYGAATLPFSVLYDAQGKEVWRFTGARDWSDAETAKLLDEAS